LVENNEKQKDQNVRRKTFTTMGTKQHEGRKITKKNRIWGFLGVSCRGEQWKATKVGGGRRRRREK
jgi:hypothetical protein